MNGRPAPRPGAGGHGPDLARLTAGFGALLRDAGVPASTERCARFADAVVLVGPRTREELYWLARVTLVDDPGQLESFARIFGQIFGGGVDLSPDRSGRTVPPRQEHLRPRGRARPTEGAGAAETATSDVPIPASDAGANPADGAPGRLLMTASVEERLRDKDFADYTEDELRSLRRLAEQVRLAAPLRRARRSRRAPGGRRLDVRRTLRGAHRTGGDPVRRSYRRRRTRPRRLVLLADVSGSMESYSRVYLQLLHGAVRGAGAEAFVLATRLTRLTRALSVGTPHEALAKAAAETPDWSGGTRLGTTLKTFLDDYGRRGMARGAVVVIVSDGWERADPRELGVQMARLHRLAHRVVWVNPRTAAEDYQPLAGGMAAALPHVDHLVSGHSLAALEEVLAVLEAI
jgi:uncharacterized protein with von Willebrand factor type A (vWA) domain